MGWWLLVPVTQRISTGHFRVKGNIYRTMFALRINEHARFANLYDSLQFLSSNQSVRIVKKKNLNSEILEALAAKSNRNRKGQILLANNAPHHVCLN